MHLILSTLDKVTHETVSDSHQPIFPNKTLGQIIDHGGSGTPDAANIPGHCVTSGYTFGDYSLSSGVCSLQYVSSSSRPAGSHANQSISTGNVYPPSQVVGSATPSGSQFQSTSSSSRFQVHRPARSRRGHQYPRYQWYTTSQYSVPQSHPPQPDICMRSATAWLQQAKADYIAAESLFGSCTLQGSETELNHCKFPALVCFLCHDTVEKCIKGVCYAFCGLRQDLVNCSNLKSLHDTLNTMPQHPAHLMEPMNDCVMTVNRHENRSRFPNFQNPPCAPATIYDVEDAQEALQATSKFLHLLQLEEKFCETLQDLGQLPARRFMSILQSVSDNQGM